MTAQLPRLELFCFGPPTARVDGREAAPEVVWRKHLALLIYLALSPNRARSRDHLLGLLWSERPDDKARRALNEAVLRLRQSLGAGRLESRESSLVLNAERLDVDVWNLDAAERDPEKALDAVRGDFLEGFGVKGAAGFEDWAMTERARYRSRAAAVLVALGERRLASSLVEAQDLARRALAIEPYSEPAVRLLMRAAALAGDSAGALAVFHRFGARLKTDLATEPSRALMALAERVQQPRWRPAAARESDGEPPLVGRPRAHEVVFKALADATGGAGQVVLIAGAPGMGRTRLLTECVGRLELEGAVVALARPIVSDHDAPWSTLRLLLRSLSRAPGLVATNPAALETLASIAPELAERVPAREPRDRAHVAGSLAAALASVAEESAVALAIDDAHLADPTSLAVLQPAMEQLKSGRAALLLTALDAMEHWPPELVALRREIGRWVAGASVELAPLATDEVLALVTPLAPWCTDAAERDRLARRLTVETGGSPFFAVTLLRALQRLTRLRADLATWPPPRATYDSPLPFSLPALVRTAIEARVAELDEERRTILCAASVGGLALDIDLIVALSGTAQPRVEDLLPELERRHLVRFDGERYTFAAALIAAVVRGECLTRGQRQTLRQRAVAALAGRADLETRVLRAELLARAQPSRDAFDGAIEVARDALAASAARTARRALAAAERAASKLSEPDMLAVLEELRQRQKRLSHGDATARD